MLKDLFQFPCPCCGKQIEIDTRSGRARAVVASEGKDKDLDQLLRAQKRDGERLGKAFDAAKESQHKQGEDLDRKLGAAKDDAKKKPDEKLRRPFDLD